MTPLPTASPDIAAPPTLSAYLAAQIEAILGRGRPARKIDALFCGSSAQPLSFQAERALRLRDNHAVYTSTGLPLRLVHRKPGRGEYRLHPEAPSGSRIETSAEDAGENLTIRTPR